MYFHIWVSVSICYDRRLTLRQHLNEVVNKETDFVTKWEHVFVTCLSCLQNVFSLVKEVSVFFWSRYFCWKHVWLLFQSKNVAGNSSLKKNGPLPQQNWKMPCRCNFFFSFSLCFLLPRFLFTFISLSSYKLDWKRRERQGIAETQAGGKETEK